MSVDDEFTSLLAHQKWTRYFGNSEKWRLPFRIAEAFTVICLLFSQCKSKWSFFLDTSPMHKGEEHVEC